MLKWKLHFVLFCILLLGLKKGHFVWILQYYCMWPNRPQYMDLWVIEKYLCGPLRFDMSTPALKRILIFFPVRSNSFFLYCFSLSVFLFPFLDVGNGGIFFSSVASLALFTVCVWAWTYLNRWGQTLREGGAVSSTHSVREEGCQQHMCEHDWHFSDTPLGSDWLCWFGNSGFLQIKLRLLGGAADSGFFHSWCVSYSTVRL